MKIIYSLYTETDQDYW